MMDVKDDGMLQVCRFHSNHGQNIILLDDKTVACRSESFGDAVTFSEQPLLPGEIFLIEIDGIEDIWSGHMRLGLTEIHPNEFSLQGQRVPPYAIPCLQNLDRSWIYPISLFAPNEKNRTFIDNVFFPALSGPPPPEPFRNILGETAYVQTTRGLIPKRLLHPKGINGPSDLRLTDQGSRIGIVYVPTENDPTKAQIRYIINGVDEGPIAGDIPLNGNPLYVVIDVYGNTKQVRIHQLNGSVSLQSACRNTILENMKVCDIQKLPLPKNVKNFLLEDV